MIRYVTSTRSTNADLAAQLSGGEGVCEGEWLVADRQTAGIGRSGRSWDDGGTGNFMGSTIVRLRPSDAPAHTLALVAGLATHAAVCAVLDAAPNDAAPTGAELGGGASSSAAADGNGIAPPRPLLKWPNDILVANAKLVGILLERRDDAVIVGIGVNLQHAPLLPDRATTALAQLGAPVDRDVFAESLAAQFALDVARWRDFGLAPIVRRWLAAAHPPGTPLVVDGVPGQFAGLDDDGALRFRREDGTLQTIASGEVRLREETGG